MRNGQNKRMRGRNNNRGGHTNNKGHHHQNPLTRVYESNGPEVKIRGTAHHVAEKYMQLARDASTSGDPVTAENLYQHAEHYLRLIAAAQEQFRQQNPYYQAPPAPSDGASDIAYEDGDEDGQPTAAQGGSSHGPSQQAGQQASQQPGQHLGQHQPYPAREPQPSFGQSQPQHRSQPQPQPAYPQSQPQPSYEGHNGLPSFITGGQPQPQPAQADAVNGHDGNDTAQPAGERFPRRRRRHPRGPRPDMAGATPQEDSRPGE